MLLRVTVVLGVALLFSLPARATVIDFESYTDPTNFSPSFSDSGATFNILNGTGFEISKFTGQSPIGWGTAGPSILCPRTPIDFQYCSGDFEVTFATDVNNLMFYFTGDNSNLSLSVESFLNGFSLGVQTFSGD